MNCPKCSQPIRFGGDPPCGCLKGKGPLSHLNFGEIVAEVFEKLETPEGKIELLEQKLAITRKMNRDYEAEIARLRAALDAVERAVKGVVRDG